MTPSPSPMALALAEAEAAGSPRRGAGRRGPDRCRRAGASPPPATKSRPTMTPSRMPRCWHCVPVPPCSGPKGLGDCDLWVTLEPCAMCAAAIGLARLKRLYFAAWDAKGGAVEHGPRLFAQPGRQSPPGNLRRHRRAPRRRTAARLLPRPATAAASRVQGAVGLSGRYRLSGYRFGSVAKCAGIAGRGQSCYDRLMRTRRRFGWTID